MKQTQNLQNGWQMKAVEETDWLAAKIPGSVYSTYLEHGKIENPYWRDNEDEALLLSEKDYEYRLEFEVSAELLKKDHVALEFAGIDTLADIELNGKWLGHTDNMHRSFRYEVKELLMETGNTLHVVLHSPLAYIREAYASCECDGSPESTSGYPHLRKAHCMFGWDWGIRLPDMGLYRPVTVTGYDSVTIEEVHITQKHEEGKVTLDLHVKTTGENADSTYKAELTTPEGERYCFTDSPEAIEIPNPQLWWPNGYGGQPLYTISITLLKNGEQEDQWSRRIGLRTLTIDTSKDEYGSAFTHVVNGVHIFGMGANYIPEDAILANVTPGKTRKLLEECREANFNLIRVWGGGYYPNDDFYDSCDELGLIVWQDFMFACAVYDLNEAFEDNIRKEITEVIKRIRHHACLGLWCGNNENEMFIAENNWVKRASQKTDYLLLNEYIIPKLVKEHNPETFYWRSSPSSGGGFDEPNAPDRGDTHYWDVWHKGVPFTEFRKFYFRYLSEFGFQSFPCLKTVESFTEPEDRNVFSYVMEKHQRNNAANGKILHYLSQTYRYPNGFETLLYASQLLQAEAIKYGVEHFRRNRGRCMGSVYWQINDNWPVASWSSIDYYGRWKALHYFAKRFFAPVLLSCAEEGCLTQSMNVNEENRQIEKAATLSVTNETKETFTGTVRWSLRDAKANAIKEGREDIEVAPLSVWTGKRMTFPEAKLSDTYFSYELWSGERRISSSAVLFCPPKHFDFCDPELTLTKNGSSITVHAGAFAKNVEIYSNTHDFKLSDNYFDMDGGEKTVEVVEGLAENLQVRSTYDIR